MLTERKCIDFLQNAREIESRRFFKIKKAMMAVSCCLLLLLAVVCAQQPSPRLDPSALRSGSSVSDLLGAQTRDFGTLEPSYVSGSVVMPRGKGVSSVTFSFFFPLSLCAGLDLQMAGWRYVSRCLDRRDLMSFWSSLFVASRFLSSK